MNYFQSFTLASLELCLRPKYDGLVSFQARMQDPAFFRGAVQDSVKELENVLQEFISLTRQEKIAGFDKPFVLLAENEIDALKNFIADPKASNYYALYVLNATQQMSRLQQEEILLEAQLQRDINQPKLDLRPIEDSELRTNIRQLLEKNATGRALLDLADTHAIRIQLRQSGAFAKASPYTPMAYFSSSDRAIYLVDADKDHLERFAALLARELRHVWQSRNISRADHHYNEIIDELIGERVLKSDAEVVALAIAVEEGWEVDPSLWKSGEYRNFKRVQSSALKEGLPADEAKARAMSASFVHFASPGALDPHERSHAYKISRLKGNLSLYIDKSPYSQSDFLLRLKTLSGAPYLNPEDLATAREKLETIGRSNHTEIKRLQPILFTL